MGRRWARAGAASVLAVTLIAAGCGDDDDEADDVGTEEPGGEPTDASGDGEPQAVEVTAVDYTFDDAPEEISAGLIELSLDNQGEVGHEVALVEIGDASLEDFLQDFPPVLEGGPFPEYAGAVMVPIEVEGGESGESTFTVTEGTYAMFCALDGDADAPPPAEGEEPPPGEPHYARGMAQLLEVGEGEGELSEADGTVTASDYTFDLDAEAGDSTLNFLNEGPDQVHFAAISVYPEGTDAAAAEAAFAQLLESEEDAPPPEGVPLGEDVGFSGIASEGLGITFEMAPLESGRTYLLACFIQDRSGGPPHAIGAQMYKAFTVE